MISIDKTWWTARKRGVDYKQVGHVDSLIYVGPFVIRKNRVTRLLSWPWVLAPLIFFGGNFIGWAFHPMYGLIIALPCMLVLWWAIPVWLDKRA